MANIIAKDLNGKLIYAEHALKGEPYYCKVCNREMRLRDGGEKIPHFYHVSNLGKKNDPLSCTSDKWHYEMSDWHYGWQTNFPIECAEISLIVGSMRHRADIIINKTVVEFQHSNMKIEEFRERNEFYTSLGYEVVWVFDLQEKWDNEYLIQTEDCKPNEYHFSRRPKLFKDFEFRNEKCLIFVEFEGLVRRVYSSYRQFAKFYTDYTMEFTRAQFVNYINTRTVFEIAMEPIVVEFEPIQPVAHNVNNAFLRTVHELWNTDYKSMVVHNTVTGQDMFIESGYNNGMRRYPDGGILGCYTTKDKYGFHYSSNYHVKDADKRIWTLVTYKKKPPVNSTEVEIAKEHIEEELQVHYLDLPSRIKFCGDYDMLNFRYGEFKKSSFIAKCAEFEFPLLFKSVGGNSHNTFAVSIEKSCYIDYSLNFITYKLNNCQWQILTDDDTGEIVFF